MPRPHRKEINLKQWRSAAGGISENAGWVVMLGQCCWVLLVAECTAWDGSSQRRAWTVTAYHKPQTRAQRRDQIRAEASVKHGFRWEAAELALQALQIELEKDEQHASR